MVGDHAHRRARRHRAPELLVDRDIDFSASSFRAREVLHGYDATWGDENLTTDDGEVTFNSCVEDAAAGNDESWVSIPTFARNTAAWISLPADVQTCTNARCDTILAETRTYYDGGALGDAPAVGDPTEVQRLKKPLTGFGLSVFTFQYRTFDPYGNVTQTREKFFSVTPGCDTDPCTETDTVYGSASHAYPTQVTKWVHEQPGLTHVAITTTTTWDERFGIPTQVVDPNGRATMTSLDDLGRILQTSSTPPGNPQGAQVPLVGYAYSTGGATGTSTANYIDRIAWADTAGTQSFESRVYYDGLLRPAEEKKQGQGGAWYTTARRYGFHGDASYQFLPFSDATLAFTLQAFGTPPAHPAKIASTDWAGRVLESHLAATSGTNYYSTTHTFDLWKETVTNPRGNQTDYARDAHGRIISVVEKNGATPVATTLYGYDLSGNLITVTDNAGNVTSMTYDSLGHKLTMVDPDMSNCAVPADCAWNYSYDFLGNLTKQIDAKGQEIDFSYDDLGRNFLKHYSVTDGSEDDVWFDFDAPGALGLVADAIKGRGDLSGGGSIANSDNYSIFSYDNWGRAVSVTKAIDNVPKTSGASFDLLGRQTSATYPTGEVAQYTIGAEGAVEQISYGGTTIASNILYDALLRPTSIGWGNTLATFTGYGENEKVETLTVGTALSLSYTFDADGNTLTIDQSAGADLWSRSFSYDWADRLLTAQEPASGTPTKEWDFQYDPIGNITFNSDWNGTGFDGSYTYGAQGGTGPAGPHAATLVGGAGAPTPYTLTYDANGAVVSESSGWSYAYNFDGGIASVHDSQGSPDPATAFTYDASGARVKKSWTSAAGAESIAYYSPAYEEHTVNGVIEQDHYVIVGSTRIALIPGRFVSSILYLHPDVQGTVSIVTDASANVLETQRFAPYGGPWAQTGTPPPALRYGYTGQEHDTESGQIHLGVRELHFAIARMLQPDSIIPKLMMPQTLNHYAYALNNPLKYVDPSGYVPAILQFCADNPEFCGQDEPKAPLRDRKPETCPAQCHGGEDVLDTSTPATRVAMGVIAGGPVVVFIGGDAAAGAGMITVLDWAGAAASRGAYALGVAALKYGPTVSDMMREFVDGQAGSVAVFPTTSALADASELARTAELDADAMQHIMERHAFGSTAARAGKFAENADIPGMVHEALDSHAARIRPGHSGRILFEHTFPSNIGADSNGANSATIRVVLDPATNRVVTAFPIRNP